MGILEFGNIVKGKTKSNLDFNCDNVKQLNQLNVNHLHHIKLKIWRDKVIKRKCKQKKKKSYIITKYNLALLPIVAPKILGWGEDQLILLLAEKLNKQTL